MARNRFSANDLRAPGAAPWVALAALGTAASLATAATPAPTTPATTTAAPAAARSATAQSGEPIPMPVARKWVEAPSKPNGSGIRVRYSVPDVVQPGQLTPVQIELSNVQAGAEVQWRLPNGSTGTSMPRGPDTYMALTPGQPNVITVNVVPAADGTVYLDVFTRQNGRSSAQSVPLKVGSGKVTLQQPGTAKPAPGGERVISLPSTPK